MDFIIIILFGLSCFSMGFWVSVKLDEEHEKNVEDILQAHRDYEEALYNGYKRAMKIIDEQTEFISQLIGGRNDV